MKRRYDRKWPDGVSVRITADVALTTRLPSGAYVVEGLKFIPHRGVSRIEHQPTGAA